MMPITLTWILFKKVNMDYKTNILSQTFDVKDVLLPELAGLYFGTLDNKKVVFDYTLYFEENKIKPIDYKVFMRYNKHYIETLIKPNNLKTSEIFYQNTDGHILVVAELVFLFVAFANPELLLYFNSLITEVITDGVTHSNGFLYSMALQRLPNEALQDIMKERENGTGS